MANESVEFDKEEASTVLTALQSILELRYKAITSGKNELGELYWEASKPLKEKWKLLISKYNKNCAIDVDAIQMIQL